MNIFGGNLLAPELILQNRMIAFTTHYQLPGHKQLVTRQITTIPTDKRKKLHRTSGRRKGLHFVGNCNHIAFIRNTSSIGRRIDSVVKRDY